MVKELLKNAGLLVILAGVIVLGIVVFTKVQTNTLSWPQPWTGYWRIAGTYCDQ